MSPNEKYPTSEIGRGLRGDRRYAALGVSLLAVAADLWVVWLDRFPESLDGRWAIALVAIISQLCLARGDLPSFGLTPPAGGWLRWARIAAYLALGAIACLTAAALVWKAMGRPLPMPKHTVEPAQIWSSFFRMCVFAPLLEEAIYRAVLSTGVAAALGPGWAIALSGFSFALLHVAYGVPSLENLFGGFILAWAYLRSGSLYVPLAYHAVGNLIVLLVQIGAWYSFGSQG